MFLVNEFCLPKNDYYLNLSAKSFVGLKSILSDINNVLTMKVTFSFIDWVAEKLSLDQVVRDQLINIALKAKPNSNGYDVWLASPKAFVAEVKCNVPINGGNVYGSALRQGIEKDLMGFLNGKRKANMDPHSCLKFFAFIDLPEVRQANEHIGTVNKLFKEKVLFVSNFDDLVKTDIICGVYV